jgi:hypothetical protein
LKPHPPSTPLGTLVTPCDLNFAALPFATRFNNTFCRGPELQLGCPRSTQSYERP